MTAKYQVALNATAGDRLTLGSTALLQLSTGQPVFLVNDPSVTTGIGLYISLDRVSSTLITTLPLGGVGFQSGGGYAQGLALCVDSSDNLYVSGTYAGNGTAIMIQRFAKQPGSLTWLPGNLGIYYANLGGNTLSGVAAVWCNTGGGTGGQGHVMTIYNDAAGNNVYSTFDAGTVGNLNAQIDWAANPVFLGSPYAGPAGAAGSNLDLATDGLGATSGTASSPNTFAPGATLGSWGISTAGVLISSQLNFYAQAATLTSSTKTRLVRYASGRYAMFYPSPTAGMVRVLTSPNGASADIPVTGGVSSPGASLAWDVAFDPATTTPTVWYYAFSSATTNTMMRVPITFPGDVPSFGTAVSDDTVVVAAGATGYHSTRAVKQPIDALHLDYQAHDNTAGALNLSGDWSALPASPLAPTLVSPAQGSVAALSAGGTLSWSFNAAPGVVGDAQTSYTLRRLLSGGAYQWWTGSAWQSTAIAVTSATSSATFPTGQWTAGAQYAWTVQVTSSAGGAAASGYAADNNFYVARAAPAAPTLTATYDPTLNRVVLVLSSPDATGVTGLIEFSRDAGVTWATVRAGSGLNIASGASVTVYDYEAGTGSSRYRASSATVAPAGVSPYTTVTVATTVSTFWLLDPTVGGSGVTIKVRRGSLSTQYPEALTEHQLLGRTDAVVVADVVGLEDGSATVWTQSATDETALLGLLTGQKVLQLQAPDGRQWYVRITSPRPTAVPYLFRAGTYRDHAISWRGQKRP